MVWCRQENRHGGTLAYDTIDGDGALIFFGKALHHAEAEAGPFLLDLSGKEGESEHSPERQAGFRSQYL